MLAEHFLAGRALANDAREALLAYSWPGNVRELENKMKRALLVADGAKITAADLGLNQLPSAPKSELAGDRELEAALAEAGGNVSKAAAILGVGRQALYRRLKAAGLEIERRLK